MNGLPPGYALRAASVDDAEAVARIIEATQLVDTGRADMTAEEVLTDWESIDLAEDAVVVTAPDGGIVASADILNRSYVSVSVYGYVHPEHQGRGIGRALVDWGNAGLATAWIARKPARVLLSSTIATPRTRPPGDSTRMPVTSRCAASTPWRPSSPSHLLRPSGRTGLPYAPSCPDKTSVQPTKQLKTRSVISGAGHRTPSSAFSRSPRRAPSPRISDSWPKMATRSPASVSVECSAARASSIPSACAGPGATVASDSPCCGMPSPCSTSATSTTSGSASTPRASPAPRAFTIEPVCT